MARELKKPQMIKEGDLKEYAGDIVIDVTPRKEPQKKIIPLTRIPVNMEAAYAAAAKPNAATPNGQMAFNVWFQKILSSNPKVKLSYKESLEAHCKAMGIGMKATETQYNTVLKHFGL